LPVVREITPKKHTEVRMLNVTFINISVISWQSVLLVKETGVPAGLEKTTDTLYHIMLY